MTSLRRLPDGTIVDLEEQVGFVVLYGEQSTAPESPQAAAQSTAPIPSNSTELEALIAWAQLYELTDPKELWQAGYEAARTFVKVQLDCATPSAAMALLGEAREDAKRKLLGLVSEYGEARIMASHGRIERADVEEAWQEVESAIDAITGTGRKGTGTSFTPLSPEQKEAMHAVVSKEGGYRNGLLDEMWQAAHEQPGTGRKEQSNEQTINKTADS